MNEMLRVERERQWKIQKRQNEQQREIYKLKQIIIGLVVFIILSAFIIIESKLNNDFMTNCMNNGYSQEYCEAHI